MGGFYQILGLSRDATEADIKHAFRRKAKDLHPDSGGDPEAFRRLKLAYDVLSDPVRRQHYDRSGAALPEGAELERLHALAGDCLVSIISQAGAAAFDDMIALTRQAVARQMEQDDIEIAALQNLATKILMVCERIHTRNTDNILRNILLKRQEDLHNKRNALERQRDSYRQILIIFEDYDYEIQVESIP
jgi:curved DNA-binding protein CbpA